MDNFAKFNAAIIFAGIAFWLGILVEKTKDPDFKPSLLSFSVLLNLGVASSIVLVLLRGLGVHSH